MGGASPRERVRRLVGGRRSVRRVGVFFFQTNKPVRVSIAKLKNLTPITPASLLV